MIATRCGSGSRSSAAHTQSRSATRSSSPDRRRRSTGSPGSCPPLGGGRRSPRAADVDQIATSQPPAAAGSRSSPIRRRRSESRPERRPRRRGRARACRSRRRAGARGGARAGTQGGSPRRPARPRASTASSAFAHHWFVFLRVHAAVTACRSSSMPRFDARGAPQVRSSDRTFAGAAASRDHAHHRQPHRAVLRR